MNPTNPSHPLLPRYRQLQEELDAAYTAPVWNSEGIDRIAEELVQVEWALVGAPRGQRPRDPGTDSRG